MGRTRTSQNTRDGRTSSMFPWLLRPLLRFFISTSLISLSSFDRTLSPFAKSIQTVYLISLSSLNAKNMYLCSFRQSPFLKQMCFTSTSVLSSGSNATMAEGVRGRRARRCEAAGLQTTLKVQVTRFLVVYPTFIKTPLALSFSYFLSSFSQTGYFFGNVCQCRRNA